MARAQGLSRKAVQRIWKQHNLKPHLIRTFKISRDKQFVEKLHDVVGLGSCYMSAIQSNPRFAVGHYNLGLLLARQGPIEEACRHWERAIKMDPESPGAQSQQALLLSHWEKIT